MFGGSFVQTKKSFCSAAIDDVGVRGIPARQRLPLVPACQFILKRQHGRRNHWFVFRCVYSKHVAEPEIPSEDARLLEPDLKIWALIHVDAVHEANLAGLACHDERLRAYAVAEEAYAF
jgi:hypothetical protein